MPPKYKGELKEKCDKICCKDNQTTFVFLLNSTEGSDHFEMVRLKHPGTEKPAYFVFTKDNRNVYELFTFSDNYRSYFIDDTVKSNGNVYITTPVNPLFLILPYLSSSPHCSPLDQLLQDDKYPDLERLVTNPAVEKNISKISDKKGVSVFGYKYSEEKALCWLEGRVRRTVEALRSHRVQVSNSTTVISNNFQKHSTDTADTQENYLRCAVGIVSEYLTGELKQKLQNRLGITCEGDQPTSKRNRSLSRDTAQQDIKKSKVNEPKDNENSENSPPRMKSEPKAKTPTVSAKEKARAKAAVGSKSISSFFKKSTA